MLSKLLSRHLPLPMIHLLFSAFFSTFFAIVAWQVVNHRPITEFDKQQAVHFYDFTASHPTLRVVTLWVTDLGSRWPRAIVVIAAAIIFAAKRHWRLAIFWAVTQCLERPLIVFAKEAFNRPRPSYPEAITLASGPAFPSGHAAGAMITYGMLAYLIMLFWHDRWQRWPIVGLMCLFILLVGLSRMLLGVHWFTDVLGGYLLGLAYISLCAAILSIIKVAEQ